MAERSNSPENERPKTSSAPRPKGARPNCLICYLCGQGFGTSSLKIHMPQCYDKKMKQWHNADPETRGPKPKDPSTVDWSQQPMTAEQFNDKQFSNFTENLAPCPNCGRKFGPDRLPIHLRSCTADNPARGVSGKPPPEARQAMAERSNSPENERPKTSSAPRPKGARPNCLICYLCGQGLVRLR